MKPWHALFKSLADLLSVKTIVTLTIVITLCYQSLQGAEISSEFLILTTAAIINYYFTKDVSSTGEAHREDGAAWKNEK